jgi:hypothetical protein
LLQCALLLEILFFLILVGGRMGETLCSLSVDRLETSLSNTQERIPLLAHRHLPPGDDKASSKQRFQEHRGGG